MIYYNANLMHPILFHKNKDDKKLIRHEFFHIAYPVPCAGMTAL